MCGEDGLTRVAGEGRPAREELVSEHADGVDVGAMIDLFLASDLLGRHVRRGAERGTAR